MGVPKFAAWLTRKYPSMVQKQAPSRSFGLYLDMNGIIHPCTHGDDDAKKKPAPKKKFFKKKKAEDDAAEGGSQQSGGEEEGSQQNSDNEGDNEATAAAAAGTMEKEAHPLSLDWTAVLPHLKPKFSSWSIPVTNLPEIAANDTEFIEHDTLVKVSQVSLAVNFLVMAARPQKMLYLAMDGVAPRAKMVQQRSRRYMAAAEKHGGSIAVGTGGGEGVASKSGSESDSEDAELRNLKEAAGALYDGSSKATPATGGGGGGVPEEILLAPEFDSNCISPGTLFMTRCSENLEKHIRYMLELAEEYDELVKATGSSIVEPPLGVPEALWLAAPFWSGLTVVLSDTNTPGEGEHKIVDFVRAQQATIEREQEQLLAAECAKVDSKKNGDQLLLPHTPPPPPLQSSPPCHVIMAKDADLILLCLALHIPNVVIMRDEFRLGAFSINSGWPLVSDREIVPEELFYAALIRHQKQQVALVEATGGAEGNVKDFSAVTTKIKKSRPMFDYYNINTLGRLIVSEVYALSKRGHPTLRDAIDFDDTCRWALEKLVEIEKRAKMPLSGESGSTTSAKRPKKASGGPRSTGGSGGDERMAVLIDAAIQCFQTASSVYSPKPGEAPAAVDPHKAVPIGFDTVKFAAIRRRPLSEEEARQLANVAMLIANDEAAIDPRDGLVKRKLKRGGWGAVLSNPCAVPTHNKAIINDYITMATLLGNDFMPRLPSGFCGDFAMDNLVEAYVHCVLPYGYLTDVSALPQAPTAAPTPTAADGESAAPTPATTTAADALSAYMHRSKDPAEIRLDQLYRLLEGYAKIEISQLRQNCFNSGKYGAASSGALVSIDELNRVQQDRMLFDPVVDGIWWTPYYETTSIVGCTSRYNMIECYSNHHLFEPKTLKGSSSNNSSPAAPASPATAAAPANKDIRKVIDHACHWYLDGIQFVFQYYVTNSTLPANINLETTPESATGDGGAEKTSDWQQKAAGRYWAWCFPYHHAPFAIDIVSYLRNLLQLDADGIPAADAPTYLSDLFKGRGATTLDVAAKDDLTDSTVIIPTPFTQLLAILPPTSASLLPAPLAQLMLKDVTRDHQGTSVALNGATSRHGVPASLSCTFPARWGIDYSVADGGKEHLATVLLPFADVDFLASCVAGVFCRGTSADTLPLVADDRIRNVNKMYTQVYEGVRRPVGEDGVAVEGSEDVVSPTFGSYVNHVSSWPAVNGGILSVAKFDYPELTARAGASSGAVGATLIRRDYGYIWDAFPSPLELDEIAIVDYATSAVKLHTDELLGSAPWAGKKHKKYNNNRRGGGPIRDASGGFFAGSVFGFGTDYVIKSKERFALVRAALDVVLRCPLSLACKGGAASNINTRCSPIADASSSPLGLAPFQEQAGLKPIISSTADMWALASRRLGVTSPNVPFAVSTGSSCDPLGLLNAFKVVVPTPTSSMMQPASLGLGDVWVYVVALVSVVSAFLALIGASPFPAAGDWGLILSLLVPTSLRAAVDVLLVGFFTAITGLAFMLLVTGSGNNIPVKESLIRRNATNHRIFAPRVDWVCAGAPSSLIPTRVDKVGSYIPRPVAANKGNSSTIAPYASWALPSATLTQSSSTTTKNKSIIEKVKSQFTIGTPSTHVGGCLATNYGRNETCFVCGAPCEEADGGAWAMLSSKMKPDRDHLNTNHGTFLEEVYLCLPSLHAAGDLSDGPSAMDHEAALGMLRRAGVVASPDSNSATSTVATTTTTANVAKEAAAFVDPQEAIPVASSSTDEVKANDEEDPEIDMM